MAGAGTAVRAPESATVLRPYDIRGDGIDEAECLRLLVFSEMVSSTYSCDRVARNLPTRMT